MGVGQGGAGQGDRVSVKKMDFSLCSFYTNGGTGFEAFFASTGTDKDCTLVIATVTKREFITLALNEFILDKQCWVRH